MAHGHLQLIRSHPLPAFFLLAYAVSWGLLLVLYWVMAVPASVAILLQTLGPTIAARVVLTATDGRPAYRAMRRTGRVWRQPLRWFALALVGIPSVCLAAAAALPGGLDVLKSTAPAAMASSFVFFLVAGFFTGPLFEEPGWRGFALPRLEGSMGPLSGTLLLGALWGAWHLPQFLIPEWAAQNGGSDAGTIGLFLLLVLALAPLLTWVYNRTGGSLWMAMVTHASVNASLSMVPVLPSGPMSVGVVAFGLIALVLLVTTRAALGTRVARFELARTRAALAPCGSRVGLNEAALVGRDDKLRAVARVELREHVTDVGLHRRPAHHQMLGDLGIRQAAGDELEDLRLPLRQLGERHAPHPHRPRLARELLD